MLLKQPQEFRLKFITYRGTYTEVLIFRSLNFLFSSGIFLDSWNIVKSLHNQSVFPFHSLVMTSLCFKLHNVFTFISSIFQSKSSVIRHKPILPANEFLSIVLDQCLALQPPQEKLNRKLRHQIISN